MWGNHVNRKVISFDDALLKFTNRLQTSSEFCNTVKMMRGFQQTWKPVSKGPTFTAYIVANDLHK